VTDRVQLEDGAISTSQATISVAYHHVKEGKCDEVEQTVLPSLVMYESRIAGQHYLCL